MQTEQGNAFAQYNLGLIYANGSQRMEQNDARAAELFRVAAD